MPKRSARQRPAVEASEFNARKIVITGVVILAVVALAGAVAHALLRSWHAPLRGPNAPLDMSIAGATLQSAPLAERAQYAAAKRRLIASYEWIDREAGIARIPVTEAMRILAGEHARPNGAEEPSAQ